MRRTGFIGSGDNGSLGAADLRDLCVQGLEDKQAQDIVVLDVRGLCAYTDYIIVASGGSDRHVAALAGGLVESARRWHVRPLGTEGMSGSRWALVDLADVVVHIFHHPLREYYDIEGLWYNAPRLTMSSPNRTPNAAGRPDARA